MKFEIIESPINTPEGDLARLNTIYDAETSFNCRFIKNEEVIAFARGEKSADGITFSMLRGYNSRVTRPEDLKDCEVEVISRTLNIVLKTFTLDNLTRRMQGSLLSANARVF